MSIPVPVAPIRRVAEEDSFAVLRRSGLLDSPPEPELDRWAIALRRNTGAAVAAFSLIDGTRTFVKSFCTIEGAAMTSTEVATSDELSDHLAARAGQSRRGSGTPGYLEAPVTVEGQLLGIVSILGCFPREFGEDERRMLGDAATTVATELALRFSQREAARVQELVASDKRVHELIARAAPLDEVLVELVTGIERWDPSVIACVVLLDRASSTLHPGAAPSLPPEYLAAIDGVVIGPNIGTCGSAAFSGQLTITADIAEDPKWAPIRDFAVGVGLRHCWSLPIKAPEGEVLGTLALYGPRPRDPEPQHLALMHDRASLAGIAIERQRVLARLIHDARHDDLTGLANRTAIFELLDEVIVRSGPQNQVAVLFLDLDGLKTMNDTLGHYRADEMLREIGERLAAAVRDGDFVGRFGGDEFVVIAEHVADEDDVAELGFRLLDAIAQPLPGIESLVVTASIGIALVDGSSADAHEAIRQADDAMYKAKHTGRDRCVFFEGRQRIRTERRVLIARHLSGAEMRGEMSLMFQPVFDLASSEIVGVEALLRWRNPELGAVSPAEFIPVAEDTGAILALGAWVVRESCETLARVVDLVGRPLELGVNVSPHQVANPTFALSVQQTLAHAEFPAEQLRLEITETSFVRPDTTAARTLRELESKGVQIVVDEFGTGFSSLTSLKNHPLEAVKIDRSFITGLPDDLRDVAIVTAVIGMATALGFTVTADGVETEAQLVALRTLHCDRAQGSALAAPVSADELIALLGMAGSTASRRQLASR